MPPIKPVVATDGLADMVRRLEKLEAENKALKEAQTKVNRISLKVSEKGALSVYGMGRFPVTLYREQWERLLSESQVSTIKAFIVEHASEFSSKNNPKLTPQTATGEKVTAPASKTRGL